MFELSAFAREVHQNDIEHGWWEKRRSAAEIRALIHSEWSEALEEARAGRPMVWHRCMDNTNGPAICEKQTECPCKLDSWESDCPAYDQKPEGVAVELIDGCIRILDYLAYIGKADDDLDIEDCVLFARNEAEHGVDMPVDEMDVSDVFDTLHLFVTASRNEPSERFHLMCAVGLAFEWIRLQGLNPETIIQQKHRYNKTRPYKHGKQF